jgi:hypothetical protein
LNEKFYSNSSIFYPNPVNDGSNNKIELLFMSKEKPEQEVEAED